MTDLTAQEWLQRELRLLYEVEPGEHDTYEKSAQRILAGLIEFYAPEAVALGADLDQAGVDYVAD